MRTIYLAYPIDLASLDKEVLDAITDVKAELLRSRVVVFDPGDAFSVGAGTKPGPEIASINNHALATADSVVAFLPSKYRTIGVPIEIDRAANSGKAVVIFTDNVDSWSLQMYLDYDNVTVAPLEVAGGPSPEAAMVRASLDWLLAQEVLPQSRDTLPYAVTGGTDALAPVRAYPDDAGLDLFVTQRTVIQPGEFVDVPTGLAVELPAGTWGFLTGRSSAFRTHHLLVINGIIDVGYRGELFSGVTNLGSETVYLERGDRVAQLIIMPNLTEILDLKQVPALSSHPRGSKGFGSSGR